MEIINTIVRQFRSTFIIDNRYKVFLTGFKNTMLITIVAALIVIAIGTVIAVIHNIASQRQRHKTLGGTLIRLLDKLLTAYVAVMRGTPLAIQLMIWAFVLLAGKDKLTVACIAFGLNSAAYVSEVIRAGINSVDAGQMEAGRSLGLDRLTTMRKIILPQAIKNILPALCNEGIAVLKETSIVSLVAVVDLTRASDLVRSRTLLAFFPLVSVAIVYFILVAGLSSAVNRMEKRLAKSDRG